MGNRLLDWFSVLMAQPGQKKHIKTKGTDHLALRENPQN